MTYRPRRQPGQLSERSDCECCDTAGSVTVSMEIERFPYGAGEDAVTLEARVPVWTCSACEDTYTGGEAEEIRHEAVCRYLGRPAPSDLREYRKLHNLSQEQFAELTTFGIASIKRWESGTQVPSASAAQALRAIISKAAAQLERAPRFRTQFTQITMLRAEKFRPSFCSVLPEIGLAA